MSTFSDNIFKRTYALTDSETWEQCAKRVSSAVAEIATTRKKELEKQFYEIIAPKKFIPAGRYLYSAGRSIQQWNNCFLLRAEDNREGWGKLVYKHIIALSTGGGVGTEYSDIRPNGTPIKRFGGYASGPIALMKMVNEVARQVMAGGKRRSALWAGLNWKHADIEDFITVKNWPLAVQAFKEKDFNFPAPLDMTNISVGLDDEFFEQAKKDKDIWDLFYRVCKSMCKTGEPGFNINLNGKQRENLRNPCIPGWVSILTPLGIKRLEDVNAGDLIWSGKRWTTINKKWSNGINKVFCFHTTAGQFIGTETHRIVQRGEKIEVKDADGIDICVGPPEYSMALNPQDIMDGLVIGDGSVHRASNNLVYLFIGEKDTDYFESEIGHLITKGRAGLNPYAWEIKTTITSAELPKTYQREVPDRFLYGSTEKVKGFLRGLFSANGCIKEKHNRISLKQTSHTLIRQVQQMLSSIGISSYITTNKPTLINHKNGEYLSKESYELNISKTKTFLEQIGFIQKYKTLSEPKNSSPRKITYDISHVEFLGEEEVFDIEVDDPEHTFWAGGLLISNCNEVVSDTDSDVCNLGSINLARINSTEELSKVTEIATTFLYLGAHGGWLPHDDFREVQSRHRRIGLGLMGIHEWCLKNGERYEPNTKLGNLLTEWRDTSDGTAKYCGGNGIGSGVTPIAVRAQAPNGTISIIGETTSSIEPIYCVAYKRRYLDNHGKWKYAYVVDPTAERLIQEGIKPEDIEDAYSLAHDVERRIAMQAFIQEFVDQGISSTINLPAWGESGNNNAKKFAETLFKYLPKLRGLTVYPDGARAGQPITAIPYEEAIKHKDVVVEENEDKCIGGVCGI